MAKVAAKVYGDALFELAVEENRCDQFLEEICAVENALDQNPQAETLLCHPGIGSEEKQDFIEKCFKGNVSDDMTGFLQILVKKGRFSERNAIFAYFTAKVKEYKKIGVALVTSPFELTAEQKTKIEKRLLDTTPPQGRILFCVSGYPTLPAEPPCRAAIALCTARCS